MWLRLIVIEIEIEIVMWIEIVFELVIVFVKREKDDSGNVWCVKTGKLSRADSLVGGHLDINENVKEKERNCENCEVWVILRLIDVNCGELSLIELWDNDLID